MGAKGQANPGLIEIQDILYDTIKKHEQLFSSECLLPSRGEKRRTLTNIYFMTLKATTERCQFLHFAKQKHIQAILSSTCYVFRGFSESETLSFRVIQNLKSDKKKKHILDSCNPTTANI